MFAGIPARTTIPCWDWPRTVRSIGAIERPPAPLLAPDCGRENYFLANTR